MPYNYQEIDLRKIILLSGGAGDFLQNLPFIIEHNNSLFRYFVATHFRGAMDIFNHVGINPEKIYYYNSINELNNIVLSYVRYGELYACPRLTYFTNCPFEISRINFNRPGKTVGIHLGGSRYSIELQKNNNLIPKNLPKTVLDGILSKHFNVLLFGSKDELDELGIPERENLRHICFQEISRSLSFVGSCDVFVGSDSVFKTMSSMQKIPTLVFLGDYVDDTRDRIFITPYVQQHIMKVFRYQDMNDKKNVSLARDAIFSFLDGFGFYRK